MKPLTRARVLFSVLWTCIALSGCTSARLIAESPDRQSRVVVREQWFVHEGRLFITLKQAMRSVDLYNTPGDFALGLAQAYWTPDSKYVGVLVCSGIGGAVLLSYDVENRKQMPQEMLLPGIRRRLEQKYGIDLKQSNPVTWACSEEGMGAFESRGRTVD